MLRRLASLGPGSFGRKEQLFSQFKGAFAENYALSSLVRQVGVSPRYWASDKPRHEVDFLVQSGESVFPIEVKSGEVVKSASLRYYAGKFPSETPLKVRLSMRNLSLDDSLLNIPLYLADHAIELAVLAARALEA